MTTEQEMIREWKKQYIKEPDKVSISFGYKELAIPNGYRMGFTKCTIAKNTDGGYKWIDAEIWLDDDCLSCPSIFRDSTLWHEFCHVIDATEELHVDHCLNFHKNLWKKPKYALADILLKFIGWIWFD